MSDTKPDHLGPEYGAQFADATVAAAYRHRPPYPGALVDHLERVAVGRGGAVLELGCGTGEIARALAARVAHVDAVDPSSAMLDAARHAEGGRHPHITWHQSTAEAFTAPCRYDLVITAESLHWMEWSIVLPAVGRMLTPGGRLVIVDRHVDRVAWWADLASLIPRFSTNSAYRRYDLIDELTTRGLFAVEGRATFSGEPHPQRIDAYIESWHSRNGFSRDRMTASAAATFDDAVRQIVLPHASEGVLRVDVTATMVWGVPVAGREAGVG